MSVIIIMIIITVVRGVIVSVVILSTSQEFCKFSEGTELQYRLDAYNTEGWLAPFPSS